MRYRRLLAVPAVALLLAAACGDDDDDDGGGAASEGQDENTGTVNLMSAGEPEEVDAYQQIFDDLINSETDYDVEIESVGDFEEQFQIRAEGGTLDVAAVQESLRSDGLDGWLLYDFNGSNPIAARLAGLSEDELIKALTRAEFEAWATRVAQRFGYTARFLSVGLVDASVGAPTQMGIFELSQN